MGKMEETTTIFVDRVSTRNNGFWYGLQLHVHDFISLFEGLSKNKRPVGILWNDYMSIQYRFVSIRWNRRKISRQIPKTETFHKYHLIITDNRCRFIYHTEKYCLPDDRPSNMRNWWSISRYMFGWSDPYIQPTWRNISIMVVASLTFMWLSHWCFISHILPISGGYHRLYSSLPSQ